MTYSHIQTPALILDKSKLSANLSRMTARAKALGVQLRPHLKTAKSLDIARLAVAGNFGGITVSTLQEADHFAAGGFTDITLAACLAPAKLDRAAALRAAGIDLKLLVDHPRMAEMIGAHPGNHHVLIEIDCGEHRTGLLPGSPDIMAIAHHLAAAPRVELAGVLTHAGHSYRAGDRETVAAVAESERRAVVEVAAQLRQAGLPCPIVSVGSTPTALHARSLEGVSEIRPGVYMLGDLFQAGIGSCARTDIAVSVLTTVIAQRPADNVLFVDAGGLALSKDRSTQALADDCGYGLVCPLDSDQPIDGMCVGIVHQEHGQIDSTLPIDFERFPIGSQLRILPNHVCMTAAAHNQYHVTEGPGEAPLAEPWPRCNGW